MLLQRRIAVLVRRTVIKAVNDGTGQPAGFQLFQGHGIFAGPFDGCVRGKLELIQLGVVRRIQGENAGQGFALGVGYGEVQCNRAFAGEFGGIQFEGEVRLAGGVIGCAGGVGFVLRGPEGSTADVAAFQVAVRFVIQLGPEEIIFHRAVFCGDYRTVLVDMVFCSLVGGVIQRGVRIRRVFFVEDFLLAAQAARGQGDSIDGLRGILAAALDLVRASGQAQPAAAGQDADAQDKDQRRGDDGNPEADRLPFRRPCFCLAEDFSPCGGKLIDTGKTLIKGLADQLIPFFFILIHGRSLLPSGFSVGHKPGACAWKPPWGTGEGVWRFPGC